MRAWEPGSGREMHAENERVPSPRDSFHLEVGPPDALQTGGPLSRIEIVAGKYGFAGQLCATRQR
jgi:hypothetical protein